MELGLAFIISAFVAGLVTFLAPCTLPLVPAYIGFISGVKREDLDNPETAKQARRQILYNGLTFVLGFSLVFIVMGMLLGFLGSQLIGFQSVLTRISGVFVILFGLFMIGVFKIPALNVEKRIKIPSFLTVGKPGSSLIIGGAFAFGWTPCVGPILGSILALAATSATAAQGALLLTVFSLGLAIPFIGVALLFSTATKYITAITKYLRPISIIGGIMLVFIGWLLLTDDFTFLIEAGYKIFEGLEYEDALIKFL